MLDFGAREMIISVTDAGLALLAIKKVEVPCEEIRRIIVEGCKAGANLCSELLDDLASDNSKQESFFKGIVEMPVSAGDYIFGEVGTIDGNYLSWRKFVEIIKNLRKFFSDPTKNEREIEVVMEEFKKYIAVPLQKRQEEIMIAIFGPCAGP
ncbi:MAG: hypothetical protein WC422_02185 [Candidatus Paceibacterota bacterium]|jgi:hypothetical protein